jgi:hypothetical protein
VIRKGRTDELTVSAVEKNVRDRQQLQVNGRNRQAQKEEKKEKEEADLEHAKKRTSKESRGRTKRNLWSDQLWASHQISCNQRTVRCQVAILFNCSNNRNALERGGEG